jgi:hypothetical protein
VNIGTTAQRFTEEIAAQAEKSTIQSAIHPAHEIEKMFFCPSEFGRLRDKQNALCHVTRRSPD